MTKNDGWTNFDEVWFFHDKFDLPRPETPQLLDDDTFFYRDEFLREELNEFHEAHQHGDLAGAADALVDLVYVALGTAVMMGLPWAELWDEVQRANMAKVRARDVSESKRDSPLDVVKPEGWVPPDIKAVLRRAGVVD